MVAKWVPEWMSQFLAHNQVYVAERRRCLEPIIRQLRPKRVLEVGCGSGRWVYLFKELFDVVGIEIDNNLVREAKHRYGDHFVLGNGVFLPFAAGSFDLVLAIDVVEHINIHQIVSMLREISRVLAPRGRLILTTPTGNRRGYLRKLESPDHVKEYSEDEIAVLLEEAGFGIVRLDYYLSPVATTLAEIELIVTGFRIVGPMYRIAAAFACRLTRPSREPSLNSGMVIEAVSRPSDV